MENGEKILNHNSPERLPFKQANILLLGRQLAGTEGT